MTLPHVRTIIATRYVTPLREGGSLPAIVEADDLGIYVLKFRGAGQGPRVLIAELLAGEIARVLGLPMPEIVFVELDPVLGRSEPDPEIQDLITASVGLNLGLDFLPGSFGFDPISGPVPDPTLASAIVWFDAYITNVDRTIRNTNMLVWHKKLWLIDNGAAFYFQYAPQDYLVKSHNPFPQIREHVLLPEASRLREVDEDLGSRLTPHLIRGIVDLIPDSWLSGDDFGGPEAYREVYVSYLLSRLQPPRPFLQEAIDARSRLV